MLYLTRYLHLSTQTRGILTYYDVPLCHTLELPELNNQPQISCIPKGLYNVHKSHSSLHGLCLRFSFVPGRSGILIHAGNTIKDTRGCILPGLDVSQTSVIYSRKAMIRLLDTLPDAFTLTIKEI